MDDGKNPSGLPHFDSPGAIIDQFEIIPRHQKLVRKQKLDILTELASKGFCNVDLVILPEDDIVLQYEAVRQNRLIYQQPEFESGTYYSRVIRQYLDFMPYLNTQRKAYKDRILNGAR